MNKETAEHIQQGNYLVTSLWREDKNIGACFSRGRKKTDWGELTLAERTEAVENMYAMADFFSRFLKQVKEGE